MPAPLENLDSVVERLDVLIGEAESIAAELERGPVVPEAGKTLVAGIRRMGKSLAARRLTLARPSNLTAEVASPVLVRIRKLSARTDRIGTAVSI